MTRQRLVVRLPKALGDVLMTLPALDRLHRAGQLGVLLGPGFAPSLLAGLPYSIERVGEGSREVAQYRTSGCEHGLLLRSSFTTALRMRRAGLKPIGYRRQRRALLLWRSIPHDFAWRKVDEYYRLAQFAVAVLGGRDAPRRYDLPPFLHLPLTAAQRQAGSDALEAARVRPPYNVVCPLAGHRKTPRHKIYPGFSELVEHLRRDGEPVVCCPAPGEEEECRRLAPGSIELAVDLAGYAGVLAGARRVVGGDTGPVHLAAALGVPCVGIYGDTSPARYSPWGARGIHVGDIGRWPSVDEVKRAIDGLPSPDA